jgi:hypothetical protein
LLKSGIFSPRKCAVSITSRKWRHFSTIGSASVSAPFVTRWQRDNHPRGCSGC